MSDIAESKWVRLSDVLQCLDELADRFRPSVLAQGDIAALATDDLHALADTTPQPDAEIEHLRAERDALLAIAERNDPVMFRAAQQDDEEMARLRAERDALLAQQKTLFAGGRPLDELVADAERWQWALRNAAKAAKLLDDWDMDGGDNADDINQAVSLEIAAIGAAKGAQP